MQNCKQRASKPRGAGSNPATPAATKSITPSRGVADFDRSYRTIKEWDVSLIFLWVENYN